MIINNNVFETFLFDNVESIKNRIAVQMNTLLKYLIFDPEIKKITQDNITVTNILEPVLNKNTLIFPIDEINKNNFKNIPREEFEKFFIFTNVDLNNQQTILNQQNKSNESNRGNDVLSMILITLKNITIDSLKFWKEERNAFKKKFNDEFDKLKNDVEIHTQRSIEFQRIPEIEYSTFETTNTQFTINFGPTNMTLAELFNNIQVTKYVPYVNMDKFFKINYNFIPSSEWLEFETKNVILMKVDCELLIELREFKNPHKKYTNAAFTILEEPGSVNRLIATMDMNVGYRNVTRPEFIARVLDALGGPKGPIFSADVQESQIQELSIVGYFSFPFQTMLIPIWVDLAMNNQYFEKVVGINEAIKASKSKPNIYLHMIGNGSDSISLMMKITDRPNIYGMEREGEKYIRSRVKTKTLNQVEKYQKIISRLFTLYNNEKSQLLSVYRSFIPNFLQDEEEFTEKLRLMERTENLGLRAIVPDLFLPNYSRKCLKRPTIISDEKAAEYMATNEKQVMRFPEYGESIPRYYTCYHETHPFPGLRDNQLENKDKYAFLPCCYSKDQKNREGSKYQHYFFRQKLRKKQQQAQDLFVTNKILPPGVAGILPKNISNLFSLIETDPHYSFNRIGMNKTINSLLECVLVANNIIPRSVEPKQRAPLLEAARLKLATIQNAMACKQELYNLSINEIIDQIKSTDYNLNATEFVHLMEEAFKCDIFIFESNNKDPNGSLIIPKHVQSYYKSKPRRQTIFIFQHTGSESDNVKYPQCELIVRTSINKKTQQKTEITSFASHDQIVVKLWNVFLKLNRSFIFNVMTPSFNLANFYKLNINSQIIDIYGKCRVINASTSNSNNFITMISDPIPPFAAITATVVYRASLVNIKIFADTIGAVFVKQKVDKENKVREVNAIISTGNIKVTFLSNDIARLHNVPIVYDEEEYKNIFGKPDNIISRFTMNKRLAKIIFQYMLYIFSIYLDGKQQPLTEIELVDFVNKRIVIIPDYTFEKDQGPSPKFNLNSVFVQNRTKLITTSKEMVRRLMYMLRLYQSNNFEKLVEYKDRINIDDFFEDVFDFEKKSFEIILDGSNALKGLIESYHTKNTITKNIKPGEIYSYFFYNEHLANIIFIAQNTDHLTFGRGPDGLALAIAFVKFWYQYGYNPHENILIESIKNNELNSNSAVNIYSYVNDRVINKIGKSSDDSNIIPGAVLGYLLNEQPIYIALMPL
ncbi:MAG: hypothetical protein ACRCZ0_07850 [Cetobacterium sp.]